MLFGASSSSSHDTRVARPWPDIWVRTMRPHRAFVVLSLLVLATAAGFASWYDRSAALRAAEDHVGMTVGVMREHASKVFETQELVLDQIRLRTAGLDWEAIGRSDQIANYLRETRDRMNQISSIWLADSTGRVRASSDSARPRSLSFENRDAFRALRESDGGTHVGEPHLGTFALSRRISSSTGAFSGVIGIEISVAYFESFLRRLDERDRHRAVLVRADGTVLVADPAENEPQRFPPRSELMQSIAGGIQNDKWNALPGGGVHFFQWRQLEPYPVYAAYAVDEDVALRSWYGRVAFYAILGAAVWGASCLIAYLASRRAAAEAALQQAQKMEAIGQLASGVAHDFNNLLTTVIGNVDRIAVDLQVTPRIRQLADAALYAAMRGATLTAQLLAFARQQPLRPDVVQIEGLLAAMLPLMTDAVGETIDVSCSPAPRLWPIQIDPGQLEVAVLNLALNARDAMPQGGTLRIKARNAIVDSSEAARRAIPAGDYVVVEVADTGVGMQADVAAHAFEPFFTTKATGKGSGLGLSMVYGFARQSGGTAEIDSRLGAGTTVMLYLPRSEQTPASEPLASHARLEAPRKASILVVEDQDGVRQLVADSLEDGGHEVKTARTAEEAMAILAQDARIQVLLTDIVLPGGMTGIDLARKARERMPDLKVLTISGNATEESISASHLEHCAFLPKPFRPSDLNRAVAELL
jgi:signal transduction histidine kinase